MRRKHKRNLIFSSLIFMVCFITVGYAYISSTLNINGVTKIKGNAWNVYYDNVVVSNGSVSATRPVITDATSLSYEVELETPGDFYEFKVDVINDGSMNAEIGSIEFDELTTDQQKYLSYSITYLDGTDISVGDKLPAHTSATIKVRIDFLSDIDGNDIPQTDQVLNLHLKTEYIEEQEFVEIVLDNIVAGKGWRSSGNVVTLDNNNTARSATKEVIDLKPGDIVVIGQNSAYSFGMFYLYLDGETYKMDTGCSAADFGFGTFSGGNCDSGWVNMSTEHTISVDRDMLVVINFKRNNNGSMSEGDAEILNQLVTITSSNTELGQTTEPETDYSETQYLLSRETTITTYEKAKLVTIPRTLSNGTTVMPHVALTASTVGGTDIKSAYTFANTNKYAVVMNAGLFNTSTKQPQGQTIIKGVSITNSPMLNDMGTSISATECYPLLISTNGTLSAAENRQVDTGDLIDAGTYYSVTGWMTLIENGQRKYEDYNAVEIVHKNSYERQIIGQYADGDYFIFTTTTSTKSGMTYDAIVTILLGLEKTVSFAYSLDGGGSTETIVDRSFINYIYESSPVGRSIPTIIYFDE